MMCCYDFQRIHNFGTKSYTQRPWHFDIDLMLFQVCVSNDLVPRTRTKHYKAFLPHLYPVSDPMLMSKIWAGSKSH